MTNADLISRQKAIEAINAVFPVDPMKSEYARGIACGAALAKTYVEQLPSAQPEIIRCKDCKHWHEDVANFISTIPRGGCKLVRGLTNGDFLCAMGERRSE